MNNLIIGCLVSFGMVMGACVIIGIIFVKAVMRDRDRNDCYDCYDCYDKQAKLGYARNYECTGKSHPECIDCPYFTYTRLPKDKHTFVQNNIDKSREELNK
jgi:hypothetical protein